MEIVNSWRFTCDHVHRNGDRCGAVCEIRDTCKGATKEITARGWLNHKGKWWCADCIDPWELCPKCGGAGTITISMQGYRCQVCKGEGLIPYGSYTPEPGLNVGVK